MQLSHDARLRHALQIWQEAIDAAAAEAPAAATAITSNAVQQEDEVTNIIYENAYKQFGASTFAGLLRSFAASDDVLWTPVSSSVLCPDAVRFAVSPICRLTIL